MSRSDISLSNSAKQFANSRLFSTIYGIIKVGYEIIITRERNVYKKNQAKGNNEKINCHDLRKQVIR